MMDIIIVNPLHCLSNEPPFEIEREFFDELSELMYDGEGEVAWPKYLNDFHELMENVEGFNETEVCMLLAHTLREYPLLWYHMLPPNCMHSFKQFSDLIEFVFHIFYPKALDKKMLQQQNARHESLMEFWECFHLLSFQALKS